MKFVQTSHGKIAYQDTGSAGFPLLLIHGNSTSHEVFRNQLNGKIGQSHRCIAFDLPGHGASDDALDPDRSYNMAGYGDVARDLMEGLGIDRYAVLGWSLGGHIALDLSAQTDAICGMMISGSPPITQGKGAINEGFEGDIEHSLGSKQIFNEEDIDTFAHVTCGPGAPYDPFLQKVVARCDGRARSLMMAKLACGVGRNQQELAINSKVPLAIVNGAEDAFIKNDFIAALDYQNLWDSKVHDLPGIGHAPFWEAPDVFDPILQRFLNDLSV
ncbi:alpha/beta fold hydrolase [Maritalea sp.]|uniref:alpha/beta fold hydrolase n=1 Tax=Maritalea sp. TaxID=2003361 RepID=UPI003EF25BE1